MKAIPLIALLPYLFLSCTPKQKQFQDFDPLKKALASNNVVAYVSYVMDDGKLIKLDTVIIDSKGNEIIEKGFGIMAPTVTKKYDSLDRLISIFHESDLDFFQRFEYESNSNNILIRNEFVGDSPVDSCYLESKTTTEYDESGLPTKRTWRVLKNSIQETYEFQYENGRIIMEKLISERTVYTEYKYVDNRLFSKTRVIGGPDRILHTDYFSTKTGLRDSSNTFEGGILVSRVQYRYYFRS